MIDEFNENYFRVKEVRWTVGLYGAWLTVENDYLTGGYREYDNKYSKKERMDYTVDVSLGQSKDVEGYAKIDGLAHTSNVVIAKPDADNYGKRQD